MNKLNLLITALFLPLASLVLGGTISGKVVGKKDTRPLAGAEIKILELNRVTVSDDSGKFVFDNVPQGTYTLLINLLPYLPLRKNHVSVSDTPVVFITLRMEQRPPELDKYMSHSDTRSYHIDSGKNVKKNKAGKIELPQPPPLQKEPERFETSPAETAPAFKQSGLKMIHT